MLPPGPASEDTAAVIGHVFPLLSVILGLLPFGYVIPKIRALPVPTEFGSRILKLLPDIPSPGGFADEATCWISVGVGREAPSVVALAGLDCADTFPAASYALTV